MSAVGIHALQGGEDVKDTLHIKRIAFLDIVKEQAEQDGETTMEEQFYADFALMTGELSRTITHVIDALGGEAKEEQ